MVHTLGPKYKHCVICHIRWHLSPEDFIKVNVGGSSFDNPHNVDFGGLLRNDGGNWIYLWFFLNLVAGLLIHLLNFQLF